MDKRRDRIAVNVRLTPEVAADLDQIMAYHGLGIKAEVIRLLIRREARRLRALNGGEQ